MGGEDKGKRRAAVEMIEVQCQNFFKCGSVFPRPSGAPGLTAVLSVSPPSAALTSELELPLRLQIPARRLALALALARTRPLISAGSKCESCILKCSSPRGTSQRRACESTASAAKSN